MKIKAALSGTAKTLAAISDPLSKWMTILAIVAT